MLLVDTQLFTAIAAKLHWFLLITKLLQYHMPNNASSISARSLHGAGHGKRLLNSPTASPSLTWTSSASSAVLWGVRELNKTRTTWFFMITARFCSGNSMYFCLPGHFALHYCHLFLPNHPFVRGSLICTSCLSYKVLTKTEQFCKFLVAGPLFSQVLREHLLHPPRAPQQSRAYEWLCWSPQVHDLPAHKVQPYHMGFHFPF